MLQDITENKSNQLAADQCDTNRGRQARNLMGRLWKNTIRELLAETGVILGGLLGCEQAETAPSAVTERGLSWRKPRYCTQ